MASAQSISLTDRQARFVAARIDGASPAVAAATSGYSETENGWQVQQSPAVMAAIERGLRQKLAADWAPNAWRIVNEIVNGDGKNGRQEYSAGIRLDAAKFILNVAGYNPPKAAEALAPDRDASEMTADELRSMVDRLEAELANRAVDVTPDIGDNAPIPTPAPDDLSDLID